MVKLKVSAEGLDPAFMDKAPDEQVRVEGGSEPDKADSNGRSI